MKNIKFQLVIFVFLTIGACKPNPEKARQTHRSFDATRKKYEIKRITEQALQDSVDAYTKIFVHQLNTSLLSVISDSTFVCDSTDFRQPPPPYVTDYQFLCALNSQIFLSIDQDTREFFRQTLQNQIQGDTVFKINPNAFLYVSPVYSETQYAGVWGILVDRKKLIQNL